MFISLSYHYIYAEPFIQDTFRITDTKIQRHAFLFEKALVLAKQRLIGSSSPMPWVTQVAGQTAAEGSGQEEYQLVVKSVIPSDNLMLMESTAKNVKSFQVFPFDNHSATCSLQVIFYLIFN